MLAYCSVSTNSDQNQAKLPFKTKMSGFLTTPWIIPQVVKQIERIQKEQPITNVLGKFRAQIVKVFHPF
jgi:hypothetical protein